MRLLARIKALSLDYAPLNFFVRVVYVPFSRWLRSFRRFLHRNNLSAYLYGDNPPDEHALKDSWNSRGFHRPYFIDCFSVFGPATSILEIGCGPGPNLYLLSQRYPDATLRGIDIDERAVQFGNTQFAREGIHNVTLSVGKVDDLSGMKASYDIVFTDAVLLLVSKGVILDAVRNMVRLARKGIVLLEWHDQTMPGKGAYRQEYWIRDYQKLFQSIAPSARITVTKLPEELWPSGGWPLYGTIVTIELHPEICRPSRETSGTGDLTPVG